MFPNFNSGTREYEKILLAKNLQEVRLDLIQLWTREFREHCNEILQMWLTRFKTIRTLVIEGPLLEEGQMAMRNSEIENLKTFKFRHLGGAAGYVWQAEKGKFLSWKKDA